MHDSYAVKGRSSFITMKRCSHSLACMQQTSDAVKMQRRHLPQPAAAAIIQSAAAPSTTTENKGPAAAAPDLHLDNPRTYFSALFYNPTHYNLNLNLKFTIIFFKNFTPNLNHSLLKFHSLFTFI